MVDRREHFLKILDFFHENGEINDATYRNAKTWLTGDPYADFADGVMDLLRPTALIDAFYQIIPFGTGGRRGVVGVGSNRMNARTVGESAQGLASYIQSLDADGSLARRGVVVAHDVRLSSAEFARITAEVIAANGIKVFLFDGPRSTPLLSFSVRHLGTVAGIVITASHNPPSDNGFKAYWDDGAQVVAPHDEAILRHVQQVDRIERLDLGVAQGRGLVEILDDRVDRVYFAMIRRDLEYCGERDATIVYSPLHGTGSTIVPPALASFGFSDVHQPPDQVAMDGRFPTVPRNYPNPEEPAALDRAIALGRELDADLVLASDPDADRLGVAVPDGEGGFVGLSGNQFQALMLDFVLARRRELGRLPENAYVLTTLVTTRLLRQIAERHGVEIVDHLLVGFKNIAAEIRAREGRGVPADAMVFASEESIGYMLHPQVRDKDSASAAVVAAQMTAYYKARGKSLLVRLREVWAEHSYFANPGFSVFLYGEAGSEQMRKLMEAMRNEPPREIAGLPVTAIVDRREDIRWDLATGRKTKMGYDRSDVLVYELGDDGLSAVAIRPSGTEPKIKHYISHNGPYSERAAVDATAAQLEQAVRQLEQKMLDQLA